MKFNKIIQAFFILFAIALLVYVFYRIVIVPKEEKLYWTGQITHRNLSQYVRATGILDVKDLMKIGSIVTGIVLKMYVNENDYVQKGQLLATIDDGLGDTVVREAQGAYDVAQAELVYQTAFFKRQEILFMDGHISSNDFDSAIQDYEKAKGNVKITQAALDKAIIEFNNKSIYAPDNGLVLHQISREGETVTASSPPTVLYEIAKDVTEMQANLEIDETLIGILKLGSPVTLTLPAYPTKLIKGTVQSINQSPTKDSETSKFYAVVPVDNSQKLLRHNLTVNGLIDLAQKNDVLAIPIDVFSFDPKTIEKIAKIKKMEFKPISNKAQKEFLEKGNLKTVWLKKDNAFVEVPVTIGIIGEGYAEVISGLQANDEIIVDVVRQEEITKYLEQLFGKWL